MVSNMKYVLVWFCLLAPCWCLSDLDNDDPNRYGTLGKVFGYSSQDELHPETPIKYEAWYEDQLVDHFNASNQGKWKQRYYINFEQFNLTRNPHSPVFFKFGGEGEMHPNFNDQIALNYSRKYGALVVDLEHRYYGKSWPTK